MIEVRQLHYYVQKCFIVSAVKTTFRGAGPQPGEQPGYCLSEFFKNMFCR